MAGGRELALELVPSLVEAAPARAVRIDGVPARHREEHVVLVVSGGDGRPAENGIGMLAAHPDMEPRAVPVRALRVHRETVAVIGEGLGRAGCRGPARVRHDLALGPPPGPPLREHDVDRVDAVGRACGTGAVCIRIGRVEVRQGWRPGEHEEETEHRREEGKMTHASKVRTNQPRVGGEFVSKS